MNILINKHQINNSKFKLELNNNKYIINRIDNIDKSHFFSFGLQIYINPFLYKNKFEGNLKFKYKFSDKTNIKIYTGSKWIYYKNNSKEGIFDENITFENLLFTNYKPKWRIGFENILDNIEIFDIQLNIIINKPILLLIGTNVFNDLNEKNFSDFNSVNCYYLKKYLSKNYHIINANQDDLIKNINYLNFKITHLITTSLHGFTKDKWNLNNFNKLINNISGKICVSTDSINDQFIIHDETYNQNIYFIPSIDNTSDKYSNQIICTNWAADEELFYPNKLNDKFIILIDDCHYEQRNNTNYNDSIHNKSKQILDYCINIMLDNKDIIIYRFGYFDNTNNFKDNYKNKHERYIVLENKIPFEKKAYYHNIANIFWCTHYETLGIPNIESAMAGCLLVHPKNFVKKELTQYLDIYEYDNINEINIDLLKKKYNYINQRKKALNFTWEKKCDKILDFL